MRNIAQWRGGIHRALQEDDVEVSNDPTWLYVYTATLFFSFITTLIASNHIRKLGGDVFRSAVRFVTTSFLICTCLHALAAGLFYAYLIASLDKWVDGVEKYEHDYNKRHGSGSGAAPTLDEILASGSVEGAVDNLLKPDNKSDGGEAAYLSKLTHDPDNMTPMLTLLLCLENIFFVLGAYWIFLLTIELYKLAKTTHDRGQANERKQIRRYASGAMIILLGFLLSGVVLLVNKRSYGHSYRILNMFELAVIILSIVISLGALFKLKLKGRKNEHIHGMLTASPLYRRLKLMMVVCTVFTLPYSLIQFGLIGMQEDDVDEIPDYVVGVVTTLYYFFGAAQALVMAGSQQCCLRILEPIIPLHLRNTPEWRAMQGIRRHESCTNGTCDGVDAPENPVFVNTDIESSSALWAQAPQEVIDAAQRIHDDLLRGTLLKFRGYEITTAGDAFQLAFHTIQEAVGYCLEVQLQLLQAKWPSELEGLVPSTKTEREFGFKCTPLFKGIRVRMGVHDTNAAEEGSIISQVHPVTGKTLYIGASEYIGREIGDMGFGGQIIVSKRIASWLRANEDKMQTNFVLDYYGDHEFCALGLGVELYEVTPKLVEGRRKVYRKRRAAESKDKKNDADTCGTQTPTSHTATGSSGESAEDSTTEFRAHHSPLDTEKKVWSAV